MTALVAQARMELLLTARRGEAVVLTLAIPAALLLVLGSTRVLGVTVDFLMPGLLALAVISSSLVAVAIGTGYDRKYLVLKRLGATPLPRWALMAAKAGSLLALEAAQVVVLVGLARMVFGWRLLGSWALLGAAILLGTVALGALGMLIAGTLRAETTLALANGLYVVLLLLGDVVLPLEALPDPLAAAAWLLPAAPLTALLRAATDGGPVPAASVALLASWAVVASALAVRLFGWEER